jgi:hypothetical protein
MAVSRRQNGIPARKQSQYAVVGGKATPQVVSTRPDAPSNLPISVVYWGYWKPTGTTYTIPGSTIASESTQVGVTAATGPAATPKTTTVASPQELLQKATSAGSFLYSIGPQTGLTGANKSGSAKTQTTKASTSPFTDAEIVQGVSGIVSAFKSSGWTDAAIITYFLTPGNLGYKQFPGLTTALFIQAAGTIINVSSLLTKKNK